MKADVTFCDAKSTTIERRRVLAATGALDSSTWITVRNADDILRRRTALKAPDGALVVWLNEGETMPPGEVNQ